jgi:ABC-2 type transport system ATP-binding protein
MRALVGVSLSLERGEVVGLVGRNGAGKTTLLRIALGLLHPSAGTVHVFGLNPLEKPVEVRRRVGFNGDSDWAPLWTSVSALIDLHRHLYSTWDEALAKRLLGAWIHSNRRIKQLSLGEKRRVYLCCALAHRPELLLLDEPANGLDPALRREFLELAVQSLSNDGSTILFSSHNMSELERIASRIVMLEKGTKVLDESLDDLKHKHPIPLEELMISLLRRK